MKTMKKILISLFIALFMSVASYAADIEAEEYEVYAALFASEKLDGIPFGYVVLEKETLKEKIRKDGWKDIDGFMVDDFNRKNEREYLLEDKFPKYKSPSDNRKLNIKVRDQRDKTFGPFDTGRTYVSRVGFNKDRTKALVYAQHVAGPEMGVGYYVFLDKVGGKWIIAGSVIGKIF